MTKSNSKRFLCSGRFVTFAPGEKSPYQNLVLAVVYPGKTLEAHGIGTQEIQIKLGKSLRQTMFTYLEPQDWLKLEGKCKLDKITGEITWKASEIVKLSPKQIEKVKKKAAAPKKDKAASQPEKTAQKKAKPARVMICQKGSCRKKGSVDVEKAFGDALVEMGCDEKVTVKATGCMGHCKAGPNVVLLPGGGSYKRVKPKDARSLVAKIL